MFRIFDEIVNRYGSFNPINHVIGIGRSLLAFGTLSTLAFTDTDLLFHPGNAPLEIIPYKISSISLFSLLQDNLVLAKLLAVITLLIVISGWKPRYTGILHWYISFSFMTSSNVIDGGDHITSALTFLLIPICLLDSRKWHWQNASPDAYWTANITANSTLFLIRFQMFILYFNACVSKFSVAEWMNGTVLYYWLEHPLLGTDVNLRPVLLPITYEPFGVTILTWGALVIEALLFFAFFIDRKWHIALLYLGLIFHFLIVLMFGLFSFFFAMAGGLVMYLGFREEVEYKNLLPVLPNVLPKKLQYENICH